MKIKCEDLSFAYDKEYILKKISLEIKSGQLTSIAGPNGIGKSTLLKCLCNIYKPNLGVVYLNNKEIATMAPRKLAKTLAFVPQNQNTSFSMTVYEMILIGRRPYINWKVTNQDENIVESIIEKLNIEHLAKREILTLSGGEKQKVAIARVLAQQADMLFLDEPTSSLDINYQIEVMNILQELTYQDNKAVIVVLHDLNLANIYSDRIFLLDDKGIQSFGKPKDVLTAENIKKVYNIEVEIVKGQNNNYIIPVKTKYNQNISKVLKTNLP